ncbi:IS1-like element transposase [Xenorhabdus sp. TS4]
MHCRVDFSAVYAYRACQAGIKEQFVDLAMNNSSICDTDRAYL